MVLRHGPRADTAGRHCRTRRWQGRLVNSHRKVGGRRFALAHELSHHLVQEDYTIDWRVASHSRVGDVEPLMDRFARTFLIPEPALREAWQHGGTGTERARPHPPPLRSVGQRSPDADHVPGWVERSTHAQ
ncbi:MULTISPECIES: ImmA/IrrE family metallo-endopeptidase [unclassified Actinomyces]|uniref:ImmA/IrrE family metallo-endopeptidase n=1 Tax=unclassified Actinomyces TaxID=2609248 RepID=UPI002A2FDF77|nr:ImmA/IrrE family metallo-endopeptidase [Actinomyces sp. AC-20-1]MCL3789000.1 ImmA/IrrE family metallo-endopeptidase [Actinomyces sp. 187325]MCL3791355.1 ImmA/IrrE family metallo-endopeptidase [Actinomyces sp. 186855]MCL3793934.1 ImmA/IrrE family metallo-endopeptidase [Actinomyces sp. 217892]